MTTKQGIILQVLAGATVAAIVMVIIIKTKKKKKLLPEVGEQAEPTKPVETPQALEQVGFSTMDTKEKRVDWWLKGNGKEAGASFYLGKTPTVVASLDAEYTYKVSSDGSSRVLVALSKNGQVVKAMVFDFSANTATRVK